MARHIKKGDMVEVITGDYKGATGRVLRVLASEGKVVVQGQNTALKHVKPSKRNPQGGRIRVEQPIDMSNVLPVNPKSSKGSKVHYKIFEDGSKKRLASDGVELGTVRKAKNS